MLTKYADLEVIEVKQSNQRLAGSKPGQKFSSFDHLPEDTYRTDDGYMYIKVRAISSRVNKNWDGWPVHELAGMKESKFRQLAKELDANETTVTASGQKVGRVLTASSIETRGDYGFKTFAGRPFFVDHNNSDPNRTRGVIVDSLLHVEPSLRKRSKEDYWSDPPENHTPETWIEPVSPVDPAQSTRSEPEVWITRLVPIEIAALDCKSKRSVLDVVVALAFKISEETFP
jgi:hypothetical protein